MRRHHWNLSRRVDDSVNIYRPNYTRHRDRRLIPAYRSRIPGRWRIVCQYSSSCGGSRDDRCWCGPRLRPGTSLQRVWGVQPFSTHSVHPLLHWEHLAVDSVFAAGGDELLRFCGIIHQRESWVYVCNRQSTTACYNQWFIYTPTGCTPSVLSAHTPSRNPKGTILAPWCITFIWKWLFFALHLVKKITFFLPEAFGGRKICQKCVCGRGPARIPLGELHDAPRLPSRLRKGIPLLPSSHLLHHSSLSTPEIVTPEILAPSALAILGVFGASTPESCQYPLKWIPG